MMNEGRTLLQQAGSSWTTANLFLDQTDVEPMVVAMGAKPNNEMVMELPSLDDYTDPTPIMMQHADMHANQTLNVSESTGDSQMELTDKEINDILVGLMPGANVNEPRRDIECIDPSGQQFTEHLNELVTFAKNEHEENRPEFVTNTQSIGKIIYSQNLFNTFKRVYCVLL